MRLRSPIFQRSSRTPRTVRPGLVLGDAEAGGWVHGLLALDARECAGPDRDGWLRSLSVSLVAESDQDALVAAVVPLAVLSEHWNGEKPEDKALETFPGYTRDKESFKTFLKNNLKPPMPPVAMAGSR